MNLIQSGSPMTRSQKIWLFILIFYSSIHLLRDILQDLHVQTALSTIFVKTSSNQLASTVLWSAINTYIIAIVEIFLALYCLKTNKFGKVGHATIIIAAITITCWFIYWFFL